MVRDSSSGGRPDVRQLTAQVLILLSDTLGVSSVVNMLTNSRTPDTTTAALWLPGTASTSHFTSRSLDDIRHRRPGRGQRSRRRNSSFAPVQAETPREQRNAGNWKKLSA